MTFHGVWRGPTIRIRMVLNVASVGVFPVQCWMFLGVIWVNRIGAHIVSLFGRGIAFPGELGNTGLTRSF